MEKDEKKVVETVENPTEVNEETVVTPEQDENAIVDNNTELDSSDYNPDEEPVVDVPVDAPVEDPTLAPTDDIIPAPETDVVNPVDTTLEPVVDPVVDVPGTEPVSADVPVGTEPVVSEPVIPEDPAVIAPVEEPGCEGTCTCGDPNCDGTCGCIGSSVTVCGVVEDPFVNCIVGDGKTEGEYLTELKAFVENNKCVLGDHSEINSTIDEFLALIDSTNYKLIAFTEGAVKSFEEFVYEDYPAIKEACKYDKYGNRSCDDPDDDDYYPEMENGECGAEEE